MFDKNIAALINQVLAEPNPENRIKIAQEMAQGFGRLVFMPPAALEQLLASLQRDSETADKHARSALRKIMPPEVDDEAIDIMTKVALKSNEYTMMILKTFLKHRAAIVDDFKAFNPEGDIPE